MPEKRQLVLQDGTSNKFWNIELKGRSFKVAYGRIGTQGQQKTKAFGSGKEAKKAYDKLVNEKLKKGYGDARNSTHIADSSDIAPKSVQALLKAFQLNADDYDELSSLSELEEVLYEEEKMLVIDWRESLADALEWTNETHEGLKLTLETEWDEDEVAGTVAYGSREVKVRFVPADEDDFNTVMRAINGLIAPKAAWRRFRSCDNTDSYSYALLPLARWNSLDKAAPKLISSMFSKLPPLATLAANKKAGQGKRIKSDWSLKKLQADYLKRPCGTAARFEKSVRGYLKSPDWAGTAKDKLLTAQMVITIPYEHRAREMVMRRPTS